MQRLRSYRNLNLEIIQVPKFYSSGFTFQSLLKPFIIPFSTLLIAITLCCALNSSASEIYIGKSEANISPTLPVALMGQLNLRIANTAATPLTANVVALESREGAKSLDAVVFVSCDLVYIPTPLLSMIRMEVSKQLAGFDGNKIILNATHTHTAPVLEDNLDESSFLYKIPVGVSPVSAYRALFVKNVADAIVKAWKSRSPGSVSWGLNRAAIPYNRRASYANNTTTMYGKTNVPEFRNLEGYEDHDINSLFFWNKEGKLIAMSIDVACPAQEVEGRSEVNADYWHPVRMALKEKFGDDLTVLSWIGAAGDQSPHIMYRKAADERMLKLSNKSRMDDIAERVVAAVEETYKTVKNDQYRNLQLVHKVEKIKLPVRIITEKEYEESKIVQDEAAALIAKDPKAADQHYAKMTWFGDVLKRFEKQKTNPDYETEIHVLRIGDAVICTNQFELFTDYGIRIQARSKALQTFVIQLAGPGTYLATEKAIRGGGYSAVCQSNIVGSEGGQILVDRTVKLIDEMWAEKTN
ncbi:MAG: hypothetical protein Q7U83_18015 [Daejeonella sp.]|nr:hypothetical protein [Daejeonella sp.]